MVAKESLLLPNKNKNDRKLKQPPPLTDICLYTKPNFTVHSSFGSTQPRACPRKWARVGIRQCIGGWRRLRKVGERYWIRGRRKCQRREQSGIRDQRESRGSSRRRQEQKMGGPHPPNMLGPLHFAWRWRLLFGGGTEVSNGVSPWMHKRRCRDSTFPPPHSSHSPSSGLWHARVVIILFEWKGTMTTQTTAAAQRKESARGGWEGLFALRPVQRCLHPWQREFARILR